MDYLGNGEVCTNTVLNKFVNKIWEKHTYCVCRKSLNCLFQLMKNGSENKSGALIFLFSVCSSQKHSLLYMLTFPLDTSHLSLQLQKMIYSEFSYPLVHFPIGKVTCHFLGVKTRPTLLIWTYIYCIYISEGCHLAISLTRTRLTRILGTMWVGHD